MTTDTNPTIERLRGVMLRHGMTQHRLAAYLGVPQSTVSNWLTGAREPAASVLRLLDVLNTIEALAPAIHAAMVPPVEPPKPKGRPRRVSGL